MAVDLSAARAHLVQCGICDYGVPGPCTCPQGNPRQVIADLLDTIERAASIHYAETIELDCDDTSGNCCSGPHEVTVCAECGHPVEAGPCPTIVGLLGVDAQQPEREVAPDER